MKLEVFQQSKIMIPEIIKTISWLKNKSTMTELIRTKTTLVHHIVPKSWEATKILKGHLTIFKEAMALKT